MRHLSLLFAAGLVLLTAAPARAQQSPHDEARRAFDLGLSLYDEHRYDAALVQLARAYELEPNWAVLYNLGLVHAALGHAVEATDSLERYLREGGEHIDDAHRRRAADELERQRPRIGSVTVTVNVDGAIVSVDGHDATGRSPFTGAIRVSVGNHSLTARAPGYENQEQNLAVAGGQSVQIRFDLRPDEAHGLLRIDASLPGADVAIDGDRQGTTPLDEALPVTPGAHHVVVSREGYLPYEADVDVRLGGQRDLHVRLDPDPDALRAGRAGHIALRVPATYEVRIDGDPSVPRPEGWTLPPGDHQIVVDAVERETWTGHVNVTRGATTTFAPPLEWTQPARAERRAEANGQRTWGWIGTIAGGVLVAAAVPLLVWNASELDGFNHNEDVLLACGVMATCMDGSMTVDHRTLDEHQKSLASQLDAVWWSAGIAGGLGLAALVIGLIELLTAPSDAAIDAAAHARLRVRPGLGGLAVDL